MTERRSKSVIFSLITNWLKSVVTVIDSKIAYKGANMKIKVIRKYILR